MVVMLLSAMCTTRCMFWLKESIGVKGMMTQGSKCQSTEDNLRLQALFSPSLSVSQLYESPQLDLPERFSSAGLLLAAEWQNPFDA